MSSKKGGLLDESMSFIKGGLKQLARSSREHAQLDGLRREMYQASTYRYFIYSASRQDGELSTLLGLLYIHHHSHLFPDLIPIHLLRAAHQILHQPDGLRHARSFLSDPSQTKLVKDALLSDAFAERKFTEIEAAELSEQAKLVHDAIVTHPLGDGLESGHECYPQLSDAELNLLLEGIKSEPVVEELLVPRRVPNFLSHKEKVEDACEHARLLLRKADANLFFGCNFKYTELDAALGGSSCAKEKLRESDQLLWYMLRNPSNTDKCSRSDHLLHDVCLREVKVLHPEHFPEVVPPQFEGEFSVEDLRVMRIFPASVPGCEPMALAYALLDECKENLKFTRDELRTRQRVCQAHRLIDKVSPSPREVYEVMVASALEGAQQALKRNRDWDTGSSCCVDPHPEPATSRIKKRKVKRRGTRASGQAER